MFTAKDCGSTIVWPPGRDRHVQYIYVVMEDEDDLAICSVAGRVKDGFVVPVAQRIAALLNLYGLLDIEAELAVEE